MCRLCVGWLTSKRQVYDTSLRDACCLTIAGLLPAYSIAADARTARHCC